MIEVFVINPGYNVFVDGLLEVHEVQEHAGSWIGSAMHCHFENIVMAVPVWIGTFIVESSIFFFCQMAAP